MYALSWADLPAIEGLPNNYRQAVGGKEVGVNRIRWVHPTILPPHVHDDAEQALVMLEGTISFTIGGEQLTLTAGDVAVVPRGVVHSGQSIADEAVFIEVFAPLRVENMLGFLGGSVLIEGDK